MYICIYISWYANMWERRDSYRGSWKDNRAHGTDVYTNTTIGSWKDDRAHGSGLYTYASGEEFNGEWVKGKKSGKGSFRFLTGDLYTGEFRDDDINGKP